MITPTADITGIDANIDHQNKSTKKIKGSLSDNSAQTTTMSVGFTSSSETLVVRTEP